MAEVKKILEVAKVDEMKVKKSEEREEKVKEVKKEEKVEELKEEREERVDEVMQKKKGEGESLVVEMKKEEEVEVVKSPTEEVMKEKAGEKKTEEEKICEKEVEEKVEEEREKEEEEEEEEEVGSLKEAIGDSLKESERKALEKFKCLVEKAIKENSFLKTPPPPTESPLTASNGSAEAPKEEALPETAMEEAPLMAVEKVLPQKAMMKTEEEKGVIVEVPSIGVDGTSTEKKPEEVTEGTLLEKMTEEKGVMEITTEAPLMAMDRTSSEKIMEEEKVIKEAPLTTKDETLPKKMVEVEKEVKKEAPLMVIDGTLPKKMVVEEKEVTKEAPLMVKDGTLLEKMPKQEKDLTTEAPLEATDGISPVIKKLEEEEDDKPKEATMAMETRIEEVTTPSTKAEVQSRDIFTDFDEKKTTDQEEKEEEKETLAAIDDNISIWGVPLLHTKGDERTDIILLKFLRAQDFKVGKAMAMLQSTVLWKKEMDSTNGNNFIDSSEKLETPTEYDSFSYLHGEDRHGRPVYYNSFSTFRDKELYEKTIGEHKVNKSDIVDPLLQRQIQVMEKGIQKLSFAPGSPNSLLQIIDLKDSPGFLKTRKIASSASFTALQEKYPHEMVAKQIVVNVPWYCAALPYPFGGKLSPLQKSKVINVRPGKVTETLFKHISPEQVPVKYGGLSRSGDTEFEGVEAPIKELIVKAREKASIELPLIEVGNVLVWDVTIVGWDVIYGEEFVPANGSYTWLIQKYKNLSHRDAEPIRNSFAATTLPGKVVLLIDNSASKKKKIAIYRYLVKKN